RLRDRDFVIAGDAIYTYGQLFDAPEPPRPVDRHNWRRSLRELKLFRREYPATVIVPGDDPQFWPQLEARYEEEAGGRGPLARLGARRRVGGRPRGKALAQRLDHAGATLLVERRIHAAHAIEDLRRDLERLLARRIGDLCEAHRGPVLDGDLRE